METLLKKSGKSYDGIHWRPDIMAHVKEKSRLCLICFSGFFRGLPDFFCIQFFSLFSVKHQITDRSGQNSYAYSNQKNQCLLFHGNPSGMWNNLKIPGVIWNLTADLYSPFVNRISTLGNDRFLSGISVFFPHLITVGSIGKLIQFQFFQKSVPVKYQD